MKFTLTLTHQAVSKTYQTILAEAAKDVTVKGFRKGKAPLSSVEAQLDKAKIYETVLNRLLPSEIQAYLKKHQLTSITQPRISLKNAQVDTDWEVEVEIAQEPEVKLNHYQQAIKDLKTKDVIWTPGKPLKDDDHGHKHPEDAESKQLTSIFDTLLKTCQLEVPSLLIDEEVERSLSRLLQQIEKLGLTIDQYLQSLKTDVEKIKAEYRETAETNLKLEFILLAIAKEEKLAASETEAQAFISKNVTDPKTLELLQKDPQAQSSLLYSLTKNKVVEFLKNL